MYIAICDDERSDQKIIVKLIEKYRTDRTTPVFYQLFTSGLDLLVAMEKEVFDILLLDIVMPKLNEIELAREIRKNDKQIRIVFLTVSTEFAIEGYEVNAHHYLLKPLSNIKLFAELDDFALGRQEPYILLKTKMGILKIPMSNIVYVEVFAKKVSFGFVDKSI